MNKTLKLREDSFRDYAFKNGILLGGMPNFEGRITKDSDDFTCPKTLHSPGDRIEVIYDDKTNKTQANVIVTRIYEAVDYDDLYVKFMLFSTDAK